VGEKTLESLKKAGIKTMGDLAKAELTELTAIKGIGKKKAEKLIEEAKKLKS
jgi:transcription termination factor NusA